MKEAFAFVGILALAISLWFMKGYTDGKVLDAKDETIQSLKDTVLSKQDNFSKNAALIDTQAGMIKSLQDAVGAKDNLLAQSNRVVAAKDETITSLQNAIKTNDDAINKDGDLISSLQDQIAKLTDKIADKNDRDTDGEGCGNDDGGSGLVVAAEKIYPKDNGFEEQNLGATGYQYFGDHLVPAGTVALPHDVPNNTPWTFHGNAGIAANGSAFNVTNATNHDHGGATSTSGQAAFFQGANCSISQMISLPAGTYSVTFSCEARPGYGAADGIAICLDQNILCTHTPADDSNFHRIVSRPITFTASGQHELKFRAIGGNSTYPSTFIDDISLNIITDPVPVPVPPVSVSNFDDGPPSRR